jgi:hypothetical protein
MAAPAYGRHPASGLDWVVETLEPVMRRIAHREHTIANLTAILFGLCSLIAGAVILLGS